MYMAYHTKASDLEIELPGRGVFRVEFKWAIVSGRDEVVSLHVSSSGKNGIIEPVVLREIPFAELIRAERQRRTQRTQTTRNSATTQKKRRTPITDEHLRHVADIYMNAWRHGIPVQRHVADVLRVSVPTAARQITLARQRGYISNNINPKRN